MPKNLKETSTIIQEKFDQKKFKLDAFFPYQVRLYHKSISNLLGEVYSSNHDLSVGEWRVMALLNELEPTTASIIIEQSTMNKVRVSRAITSLEVRNIVNRIKDPRDKRKITIRLTKDGRQILSKLIPSMNRVEASLLECLDEKDTFELQRLMNKVKNHAEQLIEIEPELAEQ